MTRDEYYDALAHHGIKGQSWGKRNGPPYPLGYSQHSSAEKSRNPKSKIGGSHNAKTDHKNKQGLTENQKRAIKIGAIAAGAALVTVGGIALYKSGKLDDLIRVGAKSLPGDLGGSANPLSINNNCKDVAEATLKRWLGVDPSAVAGQKTVTGNLHDFVNARKYNLDGVTWLGEDGQISLNGVDNIGRVERNILKNFEDGDCGFIAIDWDVAKKLKSKGYSDDRIKSITEDISNGKLESGHAFNWYIDKGRVVFYDDQPDLTVTDAKSYLNLANNNKFVEVCKITKEAFERK